MVKLLTTHRHLKQDKMTQLHTAFFKRSQTKTMCLLSTTGCSASSTRCVLKGVYFCVYVLCECVSVLKVNTLDLIMTTLNPQSLRGD